MRPWTPRRSPGASLLLTTLAGLAACLAAILLSSHQPWMGLLLSPGPHGLRIDAVAPASPASALPETDSLSGSVLVSIDGFELHANDLIDEPDAFRRYEQIEEFFERQSILHRGLALGTARLVVRTADGSLTDAALTPEAQRPIADLPPVFWFQLFCGLCGLLAGAWIGALRPAHWGARMFGLTGLGFAVTTISAAIYSSRELALDGRLFRLLSGVNHTGTIALGIALIAMFLCYPRRLVAPRTLLVLPALFLPWLAADLLHWLPDEDWGIRAPVLLMVLIAFGCAFAQWRRTEGDPRARGALRWMSLSTTLGAGLFVLTTMLSRLLGWLPALEQGYAFGLFLVIYLGIGLGLRRYRLFDLDRWAFRILLWVGGALSLLMLDALLVLSLRLAPATSLGLSMLVIGFLYLPLRNLFWHRIVERNRIADDELFQAVLQVAFSASSSRRAQAWQALLVRMFDPLELEVVHASPVDGVSGTERAGQPAILRDGLAMAFPSVASSPAVVLSYAWKGRELFGLAQLRLATQVVELMRHADASRDAYERGVAEERRRVARDLHDDLGARLLAGLKRPDLESTRTSIREAIAEMRTVMAGLSGEGHDLGACIAGLRHETASRLEASGIELDWPLTDGIDGLNVDYRICKNLSSMHRELVSNVIRHAQATRLSVTIELEEGRLRSRVRDNGKGGSIGEAAAGFGLRNLHRRIEELHGRLEIAEADPGTVVEIELPLSGERQAQ